MKIGIDARLWNETGVGRYIRNLVTNLAEIDQKNEYVLFLKKHEFQTVVTPGNNFRKKLADIHWHSLQEQTLFLKILYQEQLDLVHFPYFSFPLFYGRPFVITIHDLILFHYPTGKASRLPQALYAIKLLAYKRLMFHAATWAKKIIVVSHATKDEVITQLHADKAKIAVTYEGVDAAVIQPEKSPISLDKQYFLYVGNAYPHKNLPMLLKAFALFSKEISQVQLVLVGKDDYFYQQLQREFLALHIEKSVTVLKNVSDVQLVSLYKNALALVMPSLMEGFGLPAIEAMANNCLVAASDIPSLKEICGDAAVYFDPWVTESIAKALQYIFFNKSTLMKNKSEGLQKAAMFSWKKMAEETLQIYQSVPPTLSYKEMAHTFSQKHKTS